MKPTLEEVKEHFKDAKIVKCLCDREHYNIDDYKYISDEGNYLVTLKVSQGGERHVFIWNTNEGYTEIIETKSTTPERYKTKSIDVIDFCKLYDLNFNMGNIVKYSCRKKDQDIEDLKKIIDFAQREIKHLETFK